MPTSLQDYLDSQHILAKSRQSNRAQRLQAALERMNKNQQRQERYQQRLQEWQQAANAQRERVLRAKKRTREQIDNEGWLLLSWSTDDELISIESSLREQHVRELEQHKAAQKEQRESWSNDNYRGFEKDLEQFESTAKDWPMHFLWWEALWLTTFVRSSSEFRTRRNSVEASSTAATSTAAASLIASAAVFPPLPDIAPLQNQLLQERQTKLDTERAEIVREWETSVLAEEQSLNRERGELAAEDTLRSNEHLILAEEQAARYAEQEARKKKEQAIEQHLNGLESSMNQRQAMQKEAAMAIQQRNTSISGRAAARSSRATMMAKHVQAREARLLRASHRLPWLEYRVARQKASTRVLSFKNNNNNNIDANVPAYPRRKREEEEEELQKDEREAKQQWQEIEIALRDVQAGIAASRADAEALLPSASSLSTSASISVTAMLRGHRQQVNQQQNAPVSPQEEIWHRGINNIEQQQQQQQQLKQQQQQQPTPSEQVPLLHRPEYQQHPFVISVLARREQIQKNLREEKERLERMEQECSVQLEILERESGAAAGEEKEKKDVSVVNSDASSSASASASASPSSELYAELQQWTQSLQQIQQELNVSLAREQQLLAEESQLLREKKEALLKPLQGWRDNLKESASTLQQQVTLQLRESLQRQVREDLEAKFEKTKLDHDHRVAAAMVRAKEQRSRLSVREQELIAQKGTASISPTTSEQQQQQQQQQLFFFVRPAEHDQSRMSESKARDQDERMVRGELEYWRETAQKQLIPVVTDKLQALSQQIKLRGMSHKALYGSMQQFQYHRALQQQISSSSSTSSSSLSASSEIDPDEDLEFLTMVQGLYTEVEQLWQKLSQELEEDERLCSNLLSLLEKLVRRDLTPHLSALEQEASELQAESKRLTQEQALVDEEKQIFNDKLKRIGEEMSQIETLVKTYQIGLERVVSGMKERENWRNERQRDAKQLEESWTNPEQLPLQCEKARERVRNVRERIERWHQFIASATHDSASGATPPSAVSSTLTSLSFSALDQDVQSHRAQFGV